VGRSFAAERTSALSLLGEPDPILFGGMESTVPPAESLPALYRGILDLVAELERRGRRADAIRIRGAAAAAYSTAWDDARVRELTSLHTRATRLLDGDERSARRSTGWRRATIARRLQPRQQAR